MLLAVALIALGGAADAAARPGDVDRSFGDDGAVTATLLENYPGFLLTAIMQDDQGRIIAGGIGSGGFLTRYLADGTLDPTFGEGGMMIEPRMMWSSWPPGFARTTDGRFYVAGVSYLNSQDEPLLFRYDADGRPDASFGTDGMVATDFESFEMTALPGGALSMAGACRSSWGSGPGLRRLLPDGMPDPAFASLCWWGTDGSFLATRATPDTIVAAGLARPPFGEWNYRVVIGHYLADGRADPAYGAQAFVVAPALPFRPILVRVQADGRVIAVDDGEQGDIHLARLNGDGTLDQSFGNGGIAHLPQPWQWNSWVQALVIQRDGRILIGGGGAPIGDDDGEIDLMVARLLPNGTLDDGFGDGGVVLTNVVPYPPGDLEIAYALLETSDGRIIAGGTVWDAGDNGPIVLARFFAGTCGDAVLDAGESCDDGAANGTPASCCDADCSTRADGSACASGNACLSGEACRSGVCDGSPVVCPACTACAPATGCVFEARTDCADASAAPARARLALRRMSDARRSRIELEWKAGGSIPMASLGDPTSGDRYELCLYRDGASRELLFGAAPRAAGSCGEQSCWRRKNERFDYADRTGAPDGITRVRADARSGIVTMRGAGTTLRLPDLPLSTPAVAEVRVDGGACWRMALDAATVRRNDEGGVRAQAPARR